MVEKLILEQTNENIKKKLAVIENVVNTLQYMHN